MFLCLTPKKKREESHQRCLKPIHYYLPSKIYFNVLINIFFVDFNLLFIIGSGCFVDKKIIKKNKILAIIKKVINPEPGLNCGISLKNFKVSIN